LPGKFSRLAGPAVGALCALASLTLFACESLRQLDSDYHRQEFDRLFAKGDDCVNHGPLSKAPAYFNGALAEAEKLSNGAHYKVLALMALSQAYLDLDQYEDAAKSCSQAMVVLTDSWHHTGPGYERRDGLEVARASLLLGRIYRKQNKFEDAEKSFKYALKLEEDCLGPDSLKDDIIKPYVEMLKSLHRDNEARRLTRSDSESLMSIGEQTKIGGHLIDTGHTEEGIAVLTECLKFANENSIEDTDTCSCLAQLAAAYMTLGKLDQASQCVEKALKILEKPAISSTLFSDNAKSRYIAGYIALRKGQLAKANDYLLQSLELWKKRPDKIWQRAPVLQALGELRIKQHNYAEAKDYLKDSLGLFNQMSGKSETVATIKRELAQLGKGTAR
jgi:tetratricopeptide (TPR) repeat protein